MRAIPLLVLLLVAVPATALALTPTASACRLTECELPAPGPDCDGFGCWVCVPDLDGHVWCTFVKFPCTTDRCF